MRFLSLIGFVVGLVVFTGCPESHSGADLTVRVVTSLVPGPEFNRVETLLLASEGDGERLLDHADAIAFFGQAFTRGQTVAVFPQVARGDLTLLVRAWTPQGTVLVSQRARFDVDGAKTVTVFLDRACIAVACPSPGGSAALTACLAGQCVDPRCDPTDESTRAFCPEIIFCAEADECPDVAACATKTCVSGVCIPEQTDNACLDGQYCDVEGTDNACRDVESTMDAGVDGGSVCGTICLLDGNPCVAGYWSCDEAGAATCTGFVYAPSNTRCGDLNVCDGRGTCVPESLHDAGTDAETDAETDAAGPLAMDATIVTDASVPLDVSTAPDVAVIPDASLGADAAADSAALVADATAEDASASEDATVLVDGSIEGPCTPFLIYRDDDGDTFGNAAHFVMACATSPGFVANDDDCNDESDAINPSASEICDAIDNDCSGSVDDGLTFTNYYVDEDGDGFGTGSPTSECSVPGSGYATVAGDCNDTAGAGLEINPDATEVCDSVDNDCDTGVDEGVLTTYYQDLDGDGYGSPDNSEQSCSALPMFVTNNEDCNDVNAAAYPTAPELCDAFDNDCDTQIDETFASTAITLSSTEIYDAYKNCGQLGSITLPYNTTLTTIEFANLTTLTNGFASSGVWPNQNMTTTSISFPALVTSGAISLREVLALTTFSAPLLESSTSLSFQYNSLSTLSMPSLQTLSGGITFWGNTSLTSISFPALESTGEPYISISSNHAITSVSMPSLLTVAGGFGIDNENSMTSLVLNASTYVTGNYVLSNIPNLCNPPTVGCSGTCSTYDPC